MRKPRAYRRTIKCRAYTLQMDLQKNIELGGKNVDLVVVQAFKKDRVISAGQFAIDMSSPDGETGPNRLAHQMRS